MPAQVCKAGIVQRKILSRSAKALIMADIQKGRYSNLADANEPACLAPSADPSQYSMVSGQVLMAFHCAQFKQWCSFCYDFVETLALCAGCRIGVCVAGETSSTGCIVWDPVVDTDDFIFLCPHCTASRGETCPVSTRRLYNPLSSFLPIAPGQSIIGWTEDPRKMEHIVPVRPRGPDHLDPV